MAEGLIPFSRVIERVRKLANDYPERVAECEYFNNNGEPLCIWGHVFADLGCSLKIVGGYLKEVQSRLGEKVVAMDISIADWVAAGVEQPTRHEEEWARRTQENQDKPMAWGFAVGSVDEDFKRRGITV